MHERGPPVKIASLGSEQGIGATRAIDPKKARRYRAS
jgi:hypothetical protein